MDWGAHASRVLVSASRRNNPLPLHQCSVPATSRKSWRSRDATANTRGACAPRKIQNKTYWAISHNKFPPTPRVGLVWPRPHRPALILLFAKKFFRAPHTRARMSWTGQIFWLLAYDACAARTFFPPSPPKPFRDWPIGKLYPVTAAQLLPIRTGFLAPIHFFKLAKNWIEE